MATVAPRGTEAWCDGASLRRGNVAKTKHLGLSWPKLAAIVLLALGALSWATTEPATAAQQVTVTGVVSVIHGDPPPGSALPPRVVVTLTEAGGESWVLVGTKAASAQSLRGKQARASGVALANGNKLAVDSLTATDGSAPNASPPQGLVSGSKAYATVLCKFADVAAEPQGPAFFDALLNNTNPGLNDYWREVSYQNINLDGSTAYGWQTMAQNRAAYFDGDGNALLTTLATDCAAAQDAFVDFSAFFGINYVFNDDLDCCAWGGSANPGVDGAGNKPATWMPPWAWTAGVFGHESGHSIGLPHSGGPYGAVYDSQWDVMSAAREVHTISYHKDILGWIPAGEIYTATGAINQTVRLVNLALAPNDIGESVADRMMVKIPLGDDRFYTLEARKKTGYDLSPQGLPGEGVIIHLVDPDESSDATPEDTPAEVVDGSNNNNVNDAGAMWVPGELFEDSVNGISVAIVSEYEDGWIIAINPSTDVSVSKSANPDPATAGELLTYNVSVRNLGPGPATSVVVKDTLPAGVTYLANTDSCTGPVASVLTCSLASTLPVNGVWTFGITVRVNANVGGGAPTTLTNTVNVVAAQDSDPTSTNNNFSLTTLVVSSADLRVTKECKPDQPNKQPAGVETFCEIYVDNLGPSDAKNVVITDRIINNTPVTITSITSTSSSGAAATCPATPIASATGTTITCTDATLPSGARDTIRVEFVANATGDVNDTATVSSDTPDPDNSNNDAVGRVSFEAAADVRIAKSAPAGAVAGTSIVYSFTVTNDGPSPAADVVLKDTLPAGLSVASVSPGAGITCTPGVPGDPLQPLTCNLGTLANGGAGIITVTVNISPSLSNGTVLLNQANVTTTTLDPDGSNNNASASTTVSTSADVAVDATSDAATYKPNSQIRWKVSVTNNGPSDALNVVVTDNLPDTKQAVYQSDTGGCVITATKTLTCSLGTLASGETKEFYIYMIVKGTKGSVVNTAQVTSSTFDPAAANNSDTVNVAIKGKP